MAFIRWKRNIAGNRQAYLMHSFRDENGKPRQKMLAYLGDEASLTPEHIEELRQKYPDLKVDWENFKPTTRPITDISQLSDADLLKRMRHLRHERGLSQWLMMRRLQEFGLPRCSGTYRLGLGGREWGILEKALERNQPQPFFLNPETELAPALRKALLS